MKNEEKEQIAVANYLRVNFPEIVFHSDYGSGARLTVSQAKANKALNGGQRAYPDLFIAQPAQGFAGLFIEMKATGARAFKSNGEGATPHVREQMKIIEKLRGAGYRAEFAIGYAQAIVIIESYLKEFKKEQDGADAEF